MANKTRKKKSVEGSKEHWIESWQKAHNDHMDAEERNRKLSTLVRQLQEQVDYLHGELEQADRAMDEMEGHVDRTNFLIDLARGGKSNGGHS